MALKMDKYGKALINPDSPDDDILLVLINLIDFLENHLDDQKRNTMSHSFDNLLTLRDMNTELLKENAELKLERDKLRNENKYLKASLSVADDLEGLL